MQACHCGSGRPYDACCGPFIAGSANPPSAEALMRSRYSAYVVGAIDYLGETLHPAHRADWDRDATRRWAEAAEWLGLEIMSTASGGANDDSGVVEFAASYREDGEARRHHESSRFEKVQGRWYYVDGDTPKPETLRHQGPRVGRNDPCPCGSGRKYKKCCGK